MVHNVRLMSNSSLPKYTSAAIRASIRRYFDRETDEATEPTELLNVVQHRDRAPDRPGVVFERLMRWVLRRCANALSPQGIWMPRLRAAAHGCVAWQRLVAV